MHFRGDSACEPCRFHRLADELRGSSILGVSYFQLRLDSPSRWDFGDVHAVEIGVELLTDRGPFSVALADASPAMLGLDVHHAPVAGLLPIHVEGPEGVCPEEHPQWRARLGHVVTEVAIAFPPASAAGPASGGGLPAAISLATTAGPLGFVSGCLSADGHRVVAPGDEVLVAFDTSVLAGLTGEVLERENF